MTDHKITENMMENKQVTDAPDQPQGTAQQNKYLFDRLAKEVIIPAFNALIDSLTSAGGAGIGVNVPGVSGTTVQAVLNSMKTLIDDRYTKAQSDAKLKSKTDPLIKSVGLDPQTGIWTFTKENGQTVKVDTNLEKIALDAKLDPDTKEFVLTLADGTEQRVSLSSFVRFLEFVGSDEIEFTTTGNTVKAGIKSGSIAEDKLNTALFSRLDTAVASAESSAANADTSKNAAAESAQRAEEAAKQAEEIAGGDFVTRGEFSLHTDDQEKHVTKEERTAWNAKLDEAKRGKAGGVASLDAQGKVPAGQLPEMNYDPAGSAQTVQQALNTHAANKTLHVTAAERQAWNNKASGTHTHTAAQIGALPISGGTMTGALNMNGKALTNLPTPKNNKDAAPKDYVDTALANVPKVEFVFGSYVGDGLDTKEINLGFSPKAVFIAATSRPCSLVGGYGYSIKALRVMHFFKGMNIGDSNSSDEYAITDTGFSIREVQGDEYSTARNGIQLNDSGIIYSYVAIK